MDRAQRFGQMMSVYMYVCMQVRVCVCGCVYGVIGQMVWNSGYREEHETEVDE